MTDGFSDSQPAETPAEKRRRLDVQHQEYAHVHNRSTEISYHILRGCYFLEEGDSQACLTEWRLLDADHEDILFQTHLIAILSGETFSKLALSEELLAYCLELINSLEQTNTWKRSPRKERLKTAKAVLTHKLDQFQRGH